MHNGECLEVGLGASVCVCVCVCVRARARLLLLQEVPVHVKRNDRPIKIESTRGQHRDIGGWAGALCTRGQRGRALLRREGMARPVTSGQH
jgi:hypothetical protein